MIEILICLACAFVCGLLINLAVLRLLTRRKDVSNRELMKANEGYAIFTRTKTDSRMRSLGRDTRPRHHGTSGAILDAVLDFLEDMGDP